MESTDTESKALYRFETKRAAAEIRLGDGEVLHGQLHLQPNTLHATGFETLIELLNRSDDFVAVSLDSGGTALVSKTHVEVVTYAHEETEGDPEDRAPASGATLDVWVASGEHYRGRATWELPPAHSRVLDYLNETCRFMQIIQDDCVRYINRARIRTVYPVD